MNFIQKKNSGALAKKIQSKCINGLNFCYLNYMGKMTTSVINRPFEIIYVPVGLISNMVSIEQFQRLRRRVGRGFNVRLVGVIKGGDWDVQKTRFSEEISHIGFKERFLNGKEWEETVYFNKFNETINESGIGRGGTQSWSEYKKIYLRRWDSLYYKIKEYGYKNQNEVKGRSDKEVEVAVSRDGDILFIDGRHRLSIAKILKLKEIPVIVNVWHKSYFENILKNTNCCLITPGRAIKPIVHNYKF